MTGYAIAREKLQQLLNLQSETLYVALSGGIDSLTLMTLASKVRQTSTIAVHAVSAAVPSQASDRCRALADKFNWPLIEINAGEFENSQYVENPVNRCYYCKSSLFDAIRTKLDTKGVIATGTNRDDLGDYRPGLKAAGERAVWQPFVEADIDKKMIRVIAREVGLGELSTLPAQPCLSSRIETGIRISTDDLRFVHQVETALSSLLGPGDIRCRIAHHGVVIQLPADSKVFVDAKALSETEVLVNELCVKNDRQLKKIETYEMGSSFIRKPFTL